MAFLEPIGDVRLQREMSLWNLELQASLQSHNQDLLNLEPQLVETHNSNVEQLLEAECGLAWEWEIPCLPEF